MPILNIILGQEYNRKTARNGAAIRRQRTEANGRARAVSGAPNSVPLFDTAQLVRPTKRKTKAWKRLCFALHIWSCFGTTGHDDKNRNLDNVRTTMGLCWNDRERSYLGARHRVRRFLTNRRLDYGASPSLACRRLLPSPASPLGRFPARTRRASPLRRNVCRNERRAAGAQPPRDLDRLGPKRPLLAQA